MSRKRQEENNEHSSVWTSYSDLFMGIAILFLVMFVLAMLKSNITSTQATRQKQDLTQYALGKVPENIRNTSNKNLEKVSSSLLDLKTKHSKVNEVLEQLQGMSQDLTKREDAIRDLVNDQNQKTAMLALASEKIDLSDKKIQELSKKIDLLTTESSQQKAQLSDNNELINKTKSSLEKANIDNSNLSSNLDMLKEKNKKQEEAYLVMENSLKAQLSDNGKILSQKIIEIDTATNKIKNLNEQTTENAKLIEEQKAKIAEQKQTIEKKQKETERQASEITFFQEENNKQKSKIQNLNEDISEKSKDLKSTIEAKDKLDNKNKNLENQILSLESKNRNLDKNNKDAQVELESKNADIKALQEINKGKDKQIKSLKDISLNMNNRIEDLESNLKKDGDKIAQANAQIGNLQNMLNEKNKENSGLKKELGEAKENNVNLGNKLSGKDKELQDALSSASDFKNKLDGQNKELGGLKKDLGNAKKEISSLEEGLASKDKNISDLKGALNGKNEELGASQNEISKLKGDLGGLKEQLAKGTSDIGKKDKEIENMQKDLSGKEKAIQDLNQELADKKENLKNLKNDLAALNNKNKDLDDANKNKADNLKKLEDELQSAKNKAKEKDENIKAGSVLANNLKDKLARDASQCKEDIQQIKKECNETLALQVETPKKQAQELLDKLGNLENNLADKNKRIGDLEAQLAQNDPKYKLISAEADKNPQGTDAKKIVAGIIDDMRKNGAEIGHNATTGALVLEMDESFYFAHNSSELSDKAKEKLRQVIPLFITKILQAKELKNKIRTINITGHTSPIYNKKFVSPSDTDSIAYYYNFDLSTRRAQAVKDFLEKDKNETADFKRYLKQYPVLVSSMSYRYPIGKTKDTAPDDICENYDCKKSRRVEVSFTFD